MCWREHKGGWYVRGRGSERRVENVSNLDAPRVLKQRDAVRRGIGGVGE
jgi:hypothetical protein